MTRPERRRAALLAAAILGLHAIGLAALLLGGVGAGIAVTAYTLGLRHAFDADHIAAIDNTTRKLMSDGRRPLAVGFFFSLGHSTVVLVLSLLLGAGVRVLTGGHSAVAAAGGVIGTTVSGAFLLAIGIANLVALRRGHAAGGPINALTKRFSDRITASWQLYPLGLLFGLGFDTATEISLLVLAAGAAAGGLPLYALIALPVLFAAGMSLLDTIDGAFMAFAYGWAFHEPARRRYYNLTVTGLSVVVALGIGTLELLSVTGIAAIDLNDVGYAIAGLFVVTWLTALAIWKLARIERRWAG